MASSRNQYYATFCVNLLGLAYGLSTGWTSAAIPLLQSAESPLGCGPISNSEVSLIGSVLTVGGLAGTLMFGYAADEFGRKKSILLTAIPQIVGWILMYFAENASLLIAFRLLAGAAAGGVFTIVPVFVSEISENRLRGRLGSTLVLFFAVGILLAYVFGAFLPYFVVPWVSIPFSVVFLLGFFHIPETPLYLLKTRRYEEAERSLKFYRGVRRYAFDGDIDIKTELQSMMASLSDGSSSKLAFRDFTSTHAKKALAYGIFLMALNQFCGCFAMLNFTATIFKESGSTLSPNVSSIIVGVIQIIGALLCTLFVEKSGRKTLMTLSSFGIAFGLAVLSLYTFATSHGVDLSSFSWIPLAAFSFVIFISNLGVLTLPFLYVSEIVPTKIKGFTMVLCLTVLYVFATIVIQYLTTLIEVLGMHGAMLFFSINSFIGALLVLQFLPETKGKSYEEIAKILG